jgi:hypothetical protein
MEIMKVVFIEKAAKTKKEAIALGALKKAFEVLLAAEAKAEIPHGVLLAEFCTNAIVYLALTKGGNNKDAIGRALNKFVVGISNAAARHINQSHEYNNAGENKND